ncbi:hypothetical protein TNIN_447831 [Trichonephila inaurata madagascariensis]|uniref:Uncharacterized protein n=1 Tax=Trichonephila inaurata madagascariensis TaxID=2747483 RepID=A0A8X6KGZ8_9ARAC|nr:hypothetical protein TNIN_447831 [Trichonephila inaurata madagascariensis]
MNLLYWQITFDYAVLAADTHTQSKEFCLYVEPTVSIYPKQKSESKYYTLRNNEEVNWCINSNEMNCENEVLLLPADNCSIYTQVDNFLHMNGEVIVFVSEDPLYPLNFNESKCLNETGIPTVQISKRSAKMLKEMDRTVRIKLFKPDGLRLGYFYPILWSISVFAVVLNSHWSGSYSYKRLKQVLHLEPFDIFKDKEYIVLFLWAAVWALILIIEGLSGRYPSINYLATTLDVLFIMSSSMPLFLCLDFLTGNLKYFKFSFTICNVDIYYETLINWFISISLSTLWRLYRGMRYTWLLENVISIAFYGTLATFFPFSNFKFLVGFFCLSHFIYTFFILCLDLRVMEFIYRESAVLLDDFPIPLMIEVNDIGFDPLRACRRVKMFADVIDLEVFGVMLSYCYILDILTNKNRLYYKIMVIPYCLGRFLEDIIMLQFDAPLYASCIMPAVLLPPVLLASYRNESPLLWNGFDAVKEILVPKRNTIDLTAKTTNEQSDENSETSAVDFV